VPHPSRRAGSKGCRCGAARHEATAEPARVERRGADPSTRCARSGWRSAH